MRIVDSHCHVSQDWYEPVESLLFQMEQNGVDKAVLIQMGGQYDNAYQFECVRRFPKRFSSVVGVNTDRQDAPRILERLAGRRSQRCSSQCDNPFAGRRSTGIMANSRQAKADGELPWQEPRLCVAGLF